jgi:teichuronic acid biosynthesis glycosyltransferase TuaC
MKVLIVCSGNFPEPEKNFPTSQAFVSDQIISLEQNFGVSFEIFLIKGKGFLGYARNRKLLRQKLKNEKFDLVHAHYGLSGLLAILSTTLPVIVTFHGTDINNFITRIICLSDMLFANHSIFVSEKLRKKIWFRFPGTSVIPCGVDTGIFYVTDKKVARKESGLQPDKKYILFASSFSNRVKNYPLAEKAAGLMKTKAEILELTGMSRQQVSSILNAVDVVLMTSFTEGSPQVIKEAMACNCPVVSVDVGDVRNITRDAEQCFITSWDPAEIAFSLDKVLTEGSRSNGREIIKEYDNKIISGRIYEIYTSLTAGKAERGRR